MEGRFAIAQPDIGELLEFAKTCRRVYPGPTNQLRLSHAGKHYDSQKYVFGSLGRGFCRIFWNQDCVTVAFRGTRETYDWAHANLRFLPEPLKQFTNGRPILVHRGFQQALFHIDRATDLPGFESIIHRLEKEELIGRPLFVVGHSLGGAMATLFAMLYRQRFSAANGLPTRVVTFGSPAVGGRRMRDYYGDLHSRTLRVVNYVDPVPFTPPIGFYHVGHQIWLSPAGLSSGVSWPARLRMALRMDRLSQLASFHSMASYIFALEKIRAVGQRLPLLS